MLHHRIIGTGKPIVLLHGLALDHRHMMDVMEPGFHANSNWQRIYVDLPGHGQSPGRADIRSQDDLLEAVLDFLNTLLPQGPFAIAGLSRGSYLARGIVHRMPQWITGAALIVPGGNPSSDPARLPEPQVLAPDPSIRPHLGQGELWAHDNISVIQRWDIVEKRRQIIAPARALFDQDQEDRVSQAFDFSFAAAEATTQVDVPSLIVAGRQDGLSGYLDGIDLMHRYTRSTCAVLDTAGHGLGWERPDLFQALLRDWLDRMSLP